MGETGHVRDTCRGTRVRFAYVPGARRQRDDFTLTAAAAATALLFLFLSLACTLTFAIRALRSRDVRL